MKRTRLKRKGKTVEKTRMKFLYNLDKELHAISSKTGKSFSEIKLYFKKEYAKLPAGKRLSFERAVALGGFESTLLVSGVLLNAPMLVIPAIGVWGMAMIVDVEQRIKEKFGSVKL